MIRNILTQDEIEKIPSSFYKQAVSIFHLNEVGIDVKQTRVAEWLDVSRANVSQITGRMQNSGLIKFQDDLELTEKGLFLAKTIARRHRIVERFLSEILGLPWEEVYQETSKWQNILSTVTEKAMLSLLGNPTTGLFGNPIPYSEYKKSTTFNLLNVKNDKNYLINKITEELKRDSSMISFLQENKIIPGSRISIADSNEFSITVSTDNKKFFGLDQYIAERVFVN
jgi:DtxR family Mn-dependent transcriptional regulator